jgi:hypothetical protein
MKQEMTLTHEFVEFIPEDLRERTLYISIRFATVSHLCGCGCGSKVVTPLRPTDWKLIFDGKTISLYPSVGSWSFACRSHYWITKSTVEWSGRWSDEEIEAGRDRDRWAKRKYFGTDEAAAGGNEPSDESASQQNTECDDDGLWWKLRKWWSP